MISAFDVLTLGLVCLKLSLLLGILVGKVIRLADRHAEHHHPLCQDIHCRGECDTPPVA